MHFHQQQPALALHLVGLIQCSSLFNGWPFAEMPDDSMLLQFIDIAATTIHSRYDHDSIKAWQKITLLILSQHGWKSFTEDVPEWMTRPKTGKCRSILTSKTKLSHIDVSDCLMKSRKYQSLTPVHAYCWQQSLTLWHFSNVVLHWRASRVLRTGIWAAEVNVAKARTQMMVDLKNCMIG